MQFMCICKIQWNIKIHPESVCNGELKIENSASIITIFPAENVSLKSENFTRNVNE